MGLRKGQRNSGQFKKGKSGNPAGKPPLPEHIKKLSNETRPAIIEAYHKLSNMPYNELKSYNPITALESGIKKSLLEYAKTGNIVNIKNLWDQCHGRPVETKDVNLNNLAPWTVNVRGVKSTDNTGS